MKLHEMLKRVTTDRPVGIVDFHAYLLLHPDLDQMIKGLALSTTGALMLGAVSMDEVFCGILSWPVDALYNFGPPDDLRILPTHEEDYDHAR